MRTRLKACAAAPRACPCTPGSTRRSTATAAAAPANGGADDAVIDHSTGHPVPVVHRHVTTTTAANRDYAQPVFAALRADRPFPRRQQRLRRHGERRPGPARRRPPDGDDRPATHRRQRGADRAARHPRQQPDNARARLRHHQARRRRHGRGAARRADFEHTLQDATARLGAVRREAAPAAPSPPGSSRSERAALERTYYLSANVLKASEDKTFPGAIVASLASPWGQAVERRRPGPHVLRVLPRGVRPRPVRDVHRPGRRRRPGDGAGHRAVPVRAPAACRTGRCRATAW